MIGHSVHQSAPGADPHSIGKTLCRVDLICFRGGPRRTLAGGAGNIAPRKPIRGARGDLFPRLQFFFPHPASRSRNLHVSRGTLCVPRPVPRIGPGAARATAKSVIEGSRLSAPARGGPHPPAGTPKTSPPPCGHPLPPGGGGRGVGWPFTLLPAPTAGLEKEHCLGREALSSPPGSLGGVGEGLGEAARSAGRRNVCHDSCHPASNRLCWCPAGAADRAGRRGRRAA
jgi:hypothetical protein